LPSVTDTLLSEHFPTALQYKQGNSSFYPLCRH